MLININKIYFIDIYKTKNSEKNYVYKRRGGRGLNRDECDFI